jgi:tetratricopeptide (TPR) repeat protein
MKKNVRFYLALAAVLILSTGCAQDQYSIERELWRLKKQSVRVAANPDGTSPHEFERTLKSVEEFTQKHKDNVVVIEADFIIARLYISRKNFEKARLKLNDMAQKYSRAQIIQPEILFMKGNTYEMEDRFDLALEQYRKIIANYPLSKRGFGLPLAIGAYYQKKSLSGKSAEAYNSAAGHYLALSAKYPDSRAGLNAGAMAALCYARLGQWQKAADTLESISVSFKNTGSVDGVLWQLAVLYKQQIRDNARARAVVERLMRDYPSSRFIPGARSLIKQL